MKEDLDRQLVEKYPNLYKDRHGDIQKTCMIWGFCVDDGWYKIINDLSAKLEKLIIEHWNSQNEEGKKDMQLFYGGPLCASQVKEKFGTLRFYMNGETDEMSEIIREAEELSAKTCEICGSPGSLYVRHCWFKTLCEDCAKKENYEKCEAIEDE